VKTFSANEAAATIGVDPRALRRFLRNNDSYRNAGMGGRYQFTESEVASLGRALSKQARKAPVVPEVTILDEDPGVPLERLTPKGLPADVRKARRDARAARQQRLTARMDAVLTKRYDDQPAGE